MNVRLLFALVLAFATRAAPAATPVLRHESAGGGAFRAIASNGTRFVAAGERGRVAASSDGVTWTSQPSNLFDTFTAITTGGGVFIATTEQGGIYRSTDGTTWIFAHGTIVPLYQLAITQPFNPAAGSRSFIATGNRGLMVRSNDGQTWTNDAIPGFGFHAAAAGDMNSTWFSVVGADGLWLENSTGPWREHDTPTTATFTAAISNYTIAWA